ncbi:hypothetical protein AwErysi_02750 [Erysipelotrichaceae bacterium]|nr:hypothetical protein AwErysi_02750 [Erysipelotrichaceae bacterium]
MTQREDIANTTDNRVKIDPAYATIGITVHPTNILEIPLILLQEPPKEDIVYPTGLVEIVNGNAGRFETGIGAHLEQACKPKNKWKQHASIFMIAMSGALVGCSLFWGVIQVIPTQQISKTQNAQVIEKVVYTNDISKMVEKVTPGVVTVLIGDRRLNLVGSGSGVVYHAENNKTYILTNAHVIANAAEIRVYRNDLGENKMDVAQVIAQDNVNDIAVLVLEKAEQAYPVSINFADSDALVLGQKVIAVGSPLGSTFSGSVTEGIISGLNRQIQTDIFSQKSQSFIQTDAAINGGNSGGALIDMNGNLVGVNSAKISSADNIGLAIPSNKVIEVLKKLGVPLPDNA